MLILFQDYAYILPLSKLFIDSDFCHNYFTYPSGINFVFMRLILPVSKVLLYENVDFKAPDIKILSAIQTSYMNHKKLGIKFTNLIILGQPLVT